MSPTKRWFDRRFETGRAEADWPGIIERLRAAPGRVEALLQGAESERLTRRVAGAWSILENVGHLHDLEALSELRLDDFERDAGTLHPADVENRATWDANHNARPADEVLRGFRDARERFVARLEGLPDSVRPRMLTHPRLGERMRVVDLAFFMAEHDDHHLGRLRELLTAAGDTAA